MPKKATLVLSVNSVIVLVVAIVVLILGIFFIKNIFSKSSLKVEEAILEEQSPVQPTVDNPISLSRGKITTMSGATEVIKISVLNPTNEDWTSRPELYDGFLGCGNSDRICYISNDCSGEDDPDCQNRVDWLCGEDNVCLINNVTPDIVCDIPDEGMHDCGPRNDGIDLLLSCDNALSINKVSQAKDIFAGEVQEFTSIINVKEGAKGTFLCSIRIFGDTASGIITGFQKDIVIEVV